MRLFTAAILLSVLGAAPVLAQDASKDSFDGLSATLIGGIEGGQWYGDTQPAGVYGGQLGYDWQSDRLVLGIEGEVSGVTAKNCWTIYRSPSSAELSCIETGRDLYIGGRIGTTLGDTALLYAKAGYSNVRQTLEVQEKPIASDNVDGFRVGIGIEKRLGKNFLLKSEYRYSNYEHDYSRHQAVIGIGLRF